MTQHGEQNYTQMSVMVIDDDDFQLEFISDLLNDLGISKIQTALGGENAILKLEHGKFLPDLILCDIQMPDIDGFEMMKLLGDRHFNGGVILMSGQGAKVLYSASLVAQLARLRFLGTIEKPLQKDALLGAMDKLSPVT
ncbi:response regulator [Undibacterium rugosum]|uniref:Response regulator n=1 Tax=Undibacterium rugosum TaxID=2762291 RepID=A0A923KRY8_9BURK|nr:response regulator [Undibacterium rugosum]MBC3934354.1 response regulator [Undibacterium rugosum]MBR7779920.1 response regulator [Undibacterium rugosum]